MPYKRPGEGHYATNTTGSAITNGKPVAVDNYVGIAVKQKIANWDAGLAAQNLIATNEDFFIITKGIVQVDEVAGFAKGDAVYIIAATGVLTETASGNVKFGRVEEIEGQRGTPTNKVRINLDAKDSF